MKFKFFALVAIFYVIVETDATPTYSFLRDCKSGDETCLKKNIRKVFPVLMSGIPDLDIPKMDPLNIEHYFEVAGLAFNYTDGRFLGYKNAIIDDVEWDTQKRNVRVKLHVPFVLIDGYYESQGQIDDDNLFEGDGVFSIVMESSKYDILVDYEPKKDDEDYTHLKDFKLHFEVVDGAKFYFSKIHDHVISFMQEHYKEMFRLYGTPSIQIVFRNFLNEVQKLLRKLKI